MLGAAGFVDPRVLQRRGLRSFRVFLPCLFLFGVCYDEREAPVGKRRK